MRRRRDVDVDRADHEQLAVQAIEPCIERCGRVAVAGERRRDHPAGVGEPHALPRAVGPARPAGIDQPHIDFVLFHQLYGGLHAFTDHFTFGLHPIGIPVWICTTKGRVAPEGLK